MGGFRFNSANDFETNLYAFLQYMEQEDAELGAVLSGEAYRLKGVDESGRRTARVDFNSAVKLALDKKLSVTKEGGGE